jgi:predicted enzyme related to lactoylglutathione lyase
MARVIVNVDVDRLDEGIRFYTAAFGLRVGRRFGQNGVELVGAECAIFLLTLAPGSKPFSIAEEGRRYDRHWTPVHLDFIVDDIEASLARAVVAGALVEVPVQQHPYGKLAVMADPFGHGICFVQFEGRGYDEIATGVG